MAPRPAALLTPLLLYGGILALLPRAPAALEPWLRATLPSLVLLAGALALGRRSPGWLTLAGARRGLMAGLCLALAALVLLFAWAWPRDWVALGPGELARRVLVITLVPLAEELYFRGLLLGALAPRLGRAAALGLVSALFGLLHLPQAALVAGVMVVLSGLFCLATLASGTPLWAVALHGGWNALAVQLESPRGAQRWLLAGAGAGFVALLCLIGLRPGLIRRRD